MKKFNTLPSLARKLCDNLDNIRIMIGGFPGEKDKCNQPWEMEGSISNIHWTDKTKEHGLIMYKDIDTTRGQSGSMIYIVNDQSEVKNMLSQIELEKVKPYPNRPDHAN